jgi:hypothetical protein
MQPPTKQVTPVTVKKSVSVATIFKKHGQRAKDASSKPGHQSTKSPKTKEKSDMDKKARSSSHSPQKVKKLARKSDMHPLAVAYKGMYRPSKHANTSS